VEEARGDGRPLELLIGRVGGRGGCRWNVRVPVEKIESYEMPGRLAELVGEGKVPWRGWWEGWCLRQGTGLLGVMRVLGCGCTPRGRWGLW